jgi:8-amino-7-oxononanoate synthase
VNSKYDFLDKALTDRKKSDLFRELSIAPRGEGILNFCSNDYLNLAGHPELIKASREYAAMYGTGATASRLISGNHEWHEHLERKLAHFFGYESALLFSSGFQANLSIIQAVTSPGSVLLFDRHNHNSLIQGAKLSGAKLLRYRHRDTEHLEELLSRDEVKKAERRIIVSESLFSMDGDRAPVDDLIRFAKHHNALLLVDDAHAIGITGDDGQGLAGRRDGIDLYVGTFGKAAGGFGAFVCCSNLMREYLINYASGFIYTTALPPSVTGAAAAALRLFPELDAERKQVMNCSNILIKGLNESGIDTLLSDTHIIPVFVGDDSKVIAISKALQRQGIYVVAIRPPTVPKGTSRLRISLTTLHSPEVVSRLTTALAGIFHEHK